VAFALHPVFTILIALIPAVFSFWRGRDLLHDLDDPALPERLLALQRRNAPILGVAIGFVLITAPERIGWALPLMILARMLGAYPLRKALHNETWSVWAYLCFYLRLIVAALGFWLLVAALPAIAARAGTRDWILAGVLGAIAVAWNARSATVFRLVMHTKPVEAPAICSRFSQLTKNCGLSDVKLDQVNLRGGVFANAVALPSIRTHASIDGRMYVSDMGDRDRLVGWWDQRPIVLHAAGREAIQMPGHSDERPYQVALGSHVMAGIFPEGKTSAVRIYSLGGFSHALSR
jgi:hypothetical protein